MNEWQRQQYEQPYQYQQQREREDRLLQQQEDRQRQLEEEQRRREIEADRRYGYDEEVLHRQKQELKGFKALWKRRGLGSKTGPAGGRRR